MSLYMVPSLANALTWSCCSLLCCSNSCWRRALFAATCSALMLPIVQPGDRLAVSAVASPGLGIFGGQGSPGLHSTGQHDTSRSQRPGLNHVPATEHRQAGDHALSAVFIHQGRQQPLAPSQLQHHQQEGRTAEVVTTTGEVGQSLPTLPPSVQSPAAGTEVQGNDHEEYVQPVFQGERRYDGTDEYFHLEQFGAEGTENKGQSSPIAAAMASSRTAAAMTSSRPPALPDTARRPRSPPTTPPPPPPTPSHEVTVESLSSTELISGFQAKLICYIKMRVNIGILRFHWSFRQAGSVPGEYQEVRNVYSGYVTPPILVVKPPNNSVYLESKVHIYHVESRHAGHYVCQLTNENVNGTISVVAEDSINVHVEDNWLAPALMYRPLQNITALEGSTVPLVCDIIGGLFLKFRFRFPNGSRIRTREHGLNLSVTLDVHAGAIRLVHRLVYMIRDISKRDSGLYTCQATNKHPDSTNTRVTSVGMVYVEDRVIPSLFLSSENIRSRTIVIGQNESLYCSSFSTSWHPPVNITWFKNGLQIPDSQQVQVSSYRRQGYDSAGSFPYTELSNTLSLAHFSAADQGQYKCAVSSAQSTTEETVHLTAKAPPSVFIEQNKLFTVGLENQALLNLSFAAEPLASVLGVFHDNRQLFCRPSDNCRFSAEHGMVPSVSSPPSSRFLVLLVLKQVDVDSAGAYDLRVSTALGTVHCRIHVQVVDGA